MKKRRGSTREGDLRDQTPVESPPDSNSGLDSTPPSPDEIARRAYHRYEERGGEHGRDVDDWLEAERELTRRDIPEE